MFSGGNPDEQTVAADQFQTLPTPQWELPDDPDAHLSKIRSRVEDAKSVKRTIEGTWDDHQAYIDGEQWSENVFDPPETEQAAITVNLVRQSISVMIPLLLDSVPTWYVQAFDEAQDPTAVQLQTYLQSLWHQDKVLLDLERVYKDMLGLGTGVLKTFWDQTHLRGATPASSEQFPGRPHIAYISPYSIFPDPEAECMDDCSYLALRNVMSEDLILRVWPTADLSQMENESTGDQRQFHDLGGKTTTTSQYQVWEYYGDFGETLTIFSGNEILWHGPSPTPSQQFPITLFLLDERPEDIYGVGLLGCGGKELHDAIKEVIWGINVHERYCMNPTWTYTGPGEPVLDNKPGGVHRIPMGGQLAPNVPPPLPGYTFSLLQLLLNKWEDLTGITPSIMGRRETGLTTGVAISGLQEATQTRLRQIVRNCAIQLSDVGQKALDLVVNYSQGQLVGAMPGADPQYRANLDTKALRDQMNQPYPFRVSTQASGELPLSQSDMAQRIMAIAPLGLLDPQAILQGLGIRGWPQILERQRAAAMASLQAAAEEEQAAHIQAGAAQFQQEQSQQEQLNSLSQM